MVDYGDDKFKLGAQQEDQDYGAGGQLSARSSPNDDEFAFGAFRDMNEQLYPQP